MKIGVFTVMLPDLTPEYAARELKAAGYDGVEWRVTHVSKERQDPPSFWGNNLCTLEPSQEEAVRARALAEQAGLAIPNLGTYIGVGDLAATEQAMRFAKTAGAPQLRVGVGQLKADASYHDLFTEAKAFLNEVEVLARHYGVKALVEIHHGTICPSASLAHRLVSHFGPEAIGVIFDPGNMVHEGFENYRLGLELLGPYLAHIHLKNSAYERPERGGVWQARWAPLEDGVVNFSKLLDAAKAVGYDSWLVIEDFSSARGSKEALRHNLAFVQRLLKREQVAG